MNLRREYSKVGVCFCSLSVGLIDSLFYFCYIILKTLTLLDEHSSQILSWTLAEIKLGCRPSSDGRTRNSLKFNNMINIDPNLVIIPLQI